MSVIIEGARPEYYCDAGVAAIIVIIFESGVIGPRWGLPEWLALMTTVLLRPANVCHWTRR
jgi:hypothetical protein